MEGREETRHLLFSGKCIQSACDTSSGCKTWEQQTKGLCLQKWENYDAWEPIAPPLTRASASLPHWRQCINMFVFFLITKINISTLFKIHSYIFCRMLANLGFFGAFLWTDWSYGFGERISWRLCEILNASYQGTPDIKWLIAGDVNLDCLVKVVFAWFLYCEVFIFPFLYSIC